MEEVWWATEGKFSPFAVILAGVYVVPVAWGKVAMAEAPGVNVPHLLYMDCACCNIKPGFRDFRPGPSSGEDNGTSVAALWRSQFSTKLDAMHLMLWIGREMNAEHPRRKKFFIDLSQATFIQHQGDQQKLVEARRAARLEGPPTRTERVKFIQRVVGAPDNVAEWMLLVLKAHKELDNQAESAGLEVENLAVADIAYPLVTKRVIG